MLFLQYTHLQVQPHLKKCFDNIKALDMAKMHHHHDATHMNSSEGEKVEFKHVLKLEGVVEGWLCDVEDMMKLTLKDCLRACRVDLKKNLSRRDKWVKDWPGQMLISASQIQWTADCEKALDRGDKKGLKSLKRKQVWSLSLSLPLPHFEASPPLPLYFTSSLSPLPLYLLSSPLPPPSLPSPSTSSPFTHLRYYLQLSPIRT